MTIYVPYTYVVTHVSTGKRYYGVRFAIGCDPSDLWVKYFTSSVIIKRLIAKHGKDAFMYEVRKTFDCKASAVEWEHKVLRRLNAAKSEDWFNMSNGRKTFAQDRIGYRHSQTTVDKMKLAAKGRKMPATTLIKAIEAKKGKPGPRTGVEVSNESRDRMRNKKSKNWKVILPDGSIDIITNLKSYCIDNGLDAACMRRVAHGERPHHKNYRCELIQ